MFWVVTNAVDQLVGLDLRSADFVNGGEQGELIFHALGFQHMVDLFSGDGSLKATSRCYFLLEHLNLNQFFANSYLPAIFGRSTFPFPGQRCSFRS